MLELLESWNKDALITYVALRCGIVLCAWLFVVLACFVDFWSGIAAAKKIGEPLSSNGFRKTVEKIGDYVKVLMFALMFDMIGSLLSFYKLPFASILCAIAVLAIEAKSVIENNAKKKSNSSDIPKVIAKLIKALPTNTGNDALKQVKTHIEELIDKNSKDGKDNK